MRFFCIIICALLLLKSASFAQESNTKETSQLEKQHFSEKEWKEASDELKFQRTAPPKPVKESKPRQLPSFNFGQLPIWILYGIILLAVIAIIYLIVKNTTWARAPKPLPIATIANIQEDNSLLHSELDQYIKDALEKKEYRLALRFYYLKILKELAHKKLIVLKKESTSRDYLNQMYKTPGFSNFRSLTKTYEKAWFGTEQTEETHFNTFRQESDNLLASI